MARSRHSVRLRLSDGEKARLTTLIAAVPDGASLDDPAFSRLLDYHWQLGAEMPWYARVAWLHVFELRDVAQIPANYSVERALADLTRWRDEEWPASEREYYAGGTERDAREGHLKWQIHDANT